MADEQDGGSKDPADPDDEEEEEEVTHNGFVQGTEAWDLQLTHWQRHQVKGTGSPETYEFLISQGTDARLMSSDSNANDVVGKKYLENCMKDHTDKAKETRDCYDDLLDQISTLQDRVGQINGGDAEDEFEYVDGNNSALVDYDYKFDIEFELDESAAQVKIDAQYNTVGGTDYDPNIQTTLVGASGLSNSAGTFISSADWGVLYTPAPKSFTINIKRTATGDDPGGAFAEGDIIYSGAWGSMGSSSSMSLTFAGEDSVSVHHQTVPWNGANLTVANASLERRERRRWKSTKYKKYVCEENAGQSGTGCGTTWTVKESEETKNSDGNSSIMSGWTGYGEEFDPETIGSPSGTGHLPEDEDRVDLNSFNLVLQRLQNLANGRISQASLDRGDNLIREGDACADAAVAKLIDLDSEQLEGHPQQEAVNEILDSVGRGEGDDTLGRNLTGTKLGDIQTKMDSDLGDMLNGTVSEDLFTIDDFTSTGTSSSSEE